MIFLVLLIFSIIDFGRIKRSTIGLIIVFSIAVLINLSPIVLSDVLSNKTISSSRFSNPLQILSYNEITHAVSLTKALRLLGYESHPYSYEKIGTSEDPLFKSDINKTGDKTNLVTNPSFVLVSNTSNTNNYNKNAININNTAGQSRLPAYWGDPNRNCNNGFKCTVIPTSTKETTGWQNNSTTTLQVSTNTTDKNRWSYIAGTQIDVKPGEPYAIITHMRLNEFVTGSHIVIEGYNTTSNKWYQIVQCPSGTNGPLEWHEYSCEITIPKDTTKIRPILNAGWSSQLGKQAVTLFDDIEIIKLNDTSLIIPSWVFGLDFLIPIVGFSALIFRQDKYTISLAIISLIGLFLLKGPNPPLSGIFNFIFIHGFYIFRELWHIAFLYGFGISFLIAFFLERIVVVGVGITTKPSVLSKLEHHSSSYDNQRQWWGYRNNTSNIFYQLAYSVLSFFYHAYSKLNIYHKIILSSLLVSLIVISNGYPLLIGDFGGYIQAYSFPKDYHTIYQNLLTNNTYNTLILPLFAPIQYGSSKLSGTDPLIKYSPSNIFVQYPYNNLPTTAFTTWLHTVIQENKTNNLGKLVSGFGIKYIFLRKDFVSNYPQYVNLGTYSPFTKRWYSSLEPFLDTQRDLDIISDTINYKIYENTNNVQKIFFVPQIIGNGLSDYRTLLYVSKFTSLANIAIYPSDYDSKNYTRFNYTKDRNESTYDFIDLGRYAVTDNPRKGWTTNRDWFGYNYLLASRIHFGAFSIANNSTLSFDLPLPQKYQTKPIEMWMRAFSWPKGRIVNVDINGNNSSSYSLFSERPVFPLIKIFDGRSTNQPYHFKITNLGGSNYIEGIYIKEKDGNDVNHMLNFQNITDIDFDKLNLIEKPTTKYEYTKLNPTLWNVHINNASRPFIMGFAEPYDSSWEATIYKDGKQVGIARSVPLYAGANSFQINHIGDNMDIVIRYKPQDWFEIGLIVSGVSLSFCLFYLFYDWRKGKLHSNTKLLK
jgi:hypothetical protein